MKIVRKVIRWLVLGGLLLVLIVVCAITFAEIHIYLTRSEAKAETAAQAEFKRICDREGIDPLSFQGPKRLYVELGSRANSYTFVWSRSANETITVDVA